jgi:hypothetical protein
VYLQCNYIVRKDLYPNFAPGIATVLFNFMSDLVSYILQYVQSVQNTFTHYFSCPCGFTSAYYIPMDLFQADPNK